MYTHVPTSVCCNSNFCVYHRSGRVFTSEVVEQDVNKSNARTRVRFGGSLARLGSNVYTLPHACDKWTSVSKEQWVAKQSCYTHCKKS